MQFLPDSMIESKEIPDLSPEGIKKVILKLEQNWPVEEWKIYGVYLWPYIRIKLYIFLLNYKRSQKLKEPTSPQRTTRYSRYSKKIIRLPKLIKSLFSLCFFFFSLNHKKILFFGSHIHRTKHEDLHFNRFFDAMINTNKLEEVVYVLEFQKVFNKNYNQPSVIPLRKYLDSYKLLKKVLFRTRRKSTSVNLPGYNNFYSFLMKEYCGIPALKISVDNLESWANKIKVTSGFFEILYKKTKPSRLIFLSYYGFDDLAAAILAAHRLNIRTIDFQHGPQANVHMAYSHWDKHPKEPYNTMPQEYWNWDEASKKNIELWSKRTAGITAKVVGQPYITYYLNNQNIYSSELKYITYSLQTLSLEEMFAPKLIRIIQSCDYYWVLRLHPRSPFSVDQLIQFLKKRGLSKSKYIVESSELVPLPEVLLKSVAHVTNYSGCLIEAQMLGVPTLLIHEAGEEMFRNYIDRKTVFYSNIQSSTFEEEFKHFLNYQNEFKTERDVMPVANPLKI